MRDCVHACGCMRMYACVCVCARARVLRADGKGALLLGSVRCRHSRVSPRPAMYSPTFNAPRMAFPAVLSSSANGLQMESGQEESVEDTGAILRVLCGLPRWLSGRWMPRRYSDGYARQMILIALGASRLCGHQRQSWQRIELLVCVVIHGDSLSAGADFTYFHVS